MTVVTTTSRLLQADEIMTTLPTIGLDVIETRDLVHPTIGIDLTKIIALHRSAIIAAMTDIVTTAGNTTMIDIMSATRAVMHTGMSIDVIMTTTILDTKKVAETEIAGTTIIHPCDTNIIAAIHPQKIIAHHLQSLPNHGSNSFSSTGHVLTLS